MPIILSDDERRHFALYCREEATSARGLVEQMQKIGTPEAVMKKYITEAVAYEIVARILETTETETIG